MIHLAGASAEPSAFRGKRLRGLMAITPGVVWLLMCAGCAAPGKSARPVEAVAFVVVENHTDFAWRVSLTPSAEAATSPAWRVVMPRESVKLAFPPGGYQARREILTDGQAGAPRPPAEGAAELTLTGGRTYTWPLATLFSNDGVER